MVSSMIDQSMIKTVDAIVYGFMVFTYMVSMVIFFNDRYIVDK